MKLQREFGIYLLLIFLALGVIVFVSQKQNEKKEKTNQEIAHWKTELKRIDKTVKKVKEAKKKQKRIEHILTSIGTLEAQQKEPARLIDFININIPPDVWLTRFDETDATVFLEGYSFSDPEIAVFMKQLEKLEEFFSSIELIETRQVVVSGEKVRKFIITCARKAKTASQEEIKRIMDRYKAEAGLVP